jgi:hypothetical protein
MKRIAISLRAVKKRNRKRTGRPLARVGHCSICGEPGHNRRTHEHAKDDKEKI